MADDLLNIYDTDIAAMGEIVEWARRQQGVRMSSDALSGFQREVHERFNALGYTVNILVYETNVEDCYAFDFEITGRTEKKAFDFDRMQHEVVNNVLDLPGEEKGRKINADADLARMERERRFHGTKHKH